MAKRLKRGHYLWTAPNGREFEILKDPTSGGEPMGYGYVSWLVFSVGAFEPECFPEHGAIPAFATKGQALRTLEKVYGKGTRT